MKDGSKTKKQLINENRELRQQINEIERLQAEKNQIKSALEESEERYRSIVEDQTELICRFTPDTILTFVNEAYCTYFGRKQDQLIGFSFLLLIPEEYRESIYSNIASSLSKENPVMTHEHRVLKPDGEIGWQQWTNRAIYDRNDNLIEYQSVGRDITKRKVIEQALKKREKELEIKAYNLEELNTALNVLLKKRDEDKTGLEEQVLLNIRQLVIPYLEKLRKSGLDETQTTYADIIESNLNDIISPFSYKLSSKYLNLTPKEIMVANLVKEGKTNKEIAEILNISQRTSAFHRENIRKKLVVRNKKINLKSYLSSFT